MTYVNEHLIPTAITTTNPITVTVPNHGLNPGDRVRATRFQTFPPSDNTGMQQLNNVLFAAQNLTTNTFQLYDIYGERIDGTAYTPFNNIGIAQFTRTGPDLGVVAT